MEAIKNNSKKMLRSAIDTLEALVLNTQDEKKFESFISFKKRILLNFQYTQSPKQRNLEIDSLGIMESQHRKISYRMKNRGMYWSLDHADTMSHIILLSHNQIRELFFGNWRKEYEKYRSEGMSGAKVKEKMKRVPRSLGLMVDASWKGHRHRERDRFLNKKVRK